jgi:hypothetical protein
LNPGNFGRAPTARAPLQTRKAEVVGFIGRISIGRPRARQRLAFLADGYSVGGFFFRIYFSRATRSKNFLGDLMAGPGRHTEHGTLDMARP